MNDNIDDNQFDNNIDTIYIDDDGDVIIKCEDCGKNFEYDYSETYLELAKYHYNSHTSMKYLCSWCKLLWKKTEKKGNPIDIWHDAYYIGFNSYIRTWERIPDDELWKDKNKQSLLLENPNICNQQKFKFLKERMDIIREDFAKKMFHPDRVFAGVDLDADVDLDAGVDLDADVES